MPTGDGDVRRARDVVPALIRIRLPRPADPATVEALLARAMRDADPPIAVELARVPLLSAAHPADRSALTYALVLQPGPALAGAGHDRIVENARRVAKKALKRAFGPGFKIKIRLANSPNTLAACCRAIVGNPRATNPYQR
jgi:hypothetical protein